MSARLTIVIPTFNRAELLARAVESALAQTSRDVCVYVSNNASTDGTRDVLSRYSDDRLKIVHRTTNTTRVAHGRLIIPEIKTEFHVCLSDDDYLEPCFAERVLALFDRHPDLSFVYTGTFEHFDEEYYPLRVGPEIESSLDFILGYYAHERVVCWCACVCRTADLKRIGQPGDETIFGDVYLWSKIAFQGPVGCVQHPVAHYTALRPGHDSQMKHTPIVELAAEIREIQHDVATRAAHNGADRHYIRQLRRNMNRYSSLSNSAQFVFARIEGSSRLSCARALPATFSVGMLSLKCAPRIAAAFLLPRKVLRRMVVGAARRQRTKAGRRQRTKNEGTRA